MLVLPTSRLLFEMPHRTHIAIMERFPVFILVSDLEPTVLTEGRFGMFMLLTILDTTVGTIEFVLGNHRKIVLEDDFIDQDKSYLHQGGLDDVPMTPPRDHIHTTVIFQHTIRLDHPRDTKLVIVIGSKHVP